MRHAINMVLATAIREAWASELIAPPCSSQEIAMLQQLALESLGVSLPEEMTRFLRVTNGLETNRGTLFSSRHQVMWRDWDDTDHTSDEVPPLLMSELYSIVEETVVARSLPPPFPYVLLGQSDVDRFIWDPASNRYAIIERTSPNRLQAFEAFDLLLAAIVPNPTYSALVSEMRSVTD